MLQHRSAAALASKHRLTVYRRVSPKGSRPGGFLCHDMARRLRLPRHAPVDGLPPCGPIRKPPGRLSLPRQSPASACHGKPQLTAYRHVAPKESCPGCFLCHDMARRLRLPRQAPVDGLPPCGPERKPPCRFLCHGGARRLRLPRQALVNGLPRCGLERKPPG